MLSKKVFFLLLLAAALFACGEKQNTEEAAKDGHAESSEHGEEAGHGDENIVRLDAEQQQQAGIKIESVELRPLQHTISVPGRIVFNERRLAHLTARVPGRVEQVYAFLGDRVQKDALLATIYSQDYLAAQSEFIQAEERLKLATARKDSSELPTARAIFESARRKLLVIGATEKDLNEIADSHVPKTLLEIRAPFAGTVTEASEILGHFVEVGGTMFHVADLSKLWVLADIYEKDLAAIKPGLPAEIEVAAYPSEKFHGRLTTIFDVLDETTRTVKARIEVENTTGKLKPQMFATVYLQSGAVSDQLMVPEAAVQIEGEQHFVFVPESDSSFAKREVRTGQKIDGMIAITEGLAAGEKVVAAGAFVLRSELAKESFGEHGH
ncbi:MAG: efflux RND transporter periplasmic adaptor subunit [bacterium]